MRYFISDTHFGHQKCWDTFKRTDGTPLREFSSTEEMDQTMIDNWNSVVKPQDSVYHLGDFTINRRFLRIGRYLNGKKRLVRGNHDVFRTSEYIEIGFEEIYGVFVDPKAGYMCSHIPLHPDSLRQPLNIHGHLHHGRVLDKDGNIDRRYVCVSVEMTDYKPVSLEQIREMI